MCDQPEVSKEHVPPKCFFPEQKDLPKGIDYRKNLITVPSCEKHNMSTSKDDEYLLAVIITHHQNNQAAYNHFMSKILRMLKRKTSLTERIVKSSTPVTIAGQSTALLNAEPDRVYPELKKIACGIHFHHFGVKWTVTVFGMNQKFIAYYRVSTERQGQSGLGLDAQRTAVLSHITGTSELIAEFTEIESGKKNDRPQLAAALASCKKQKAKLIIAKLDRLARNVAFIANLMESGVEFIAADNPHANKLMLHMLAAFAEHEREQISKRTKDALAAAKARGTRLGNPCPAESLARGRTTIGI